jgi:3' exoribonuclease, RNase T-like
MKNVMLDLETLGNDSNAAVIQIGACYFDPDTGEIGETLKLNVSAQSAIDSHASISGDTIYWWLQQSQEARESVSKIPQTNYHEAFSQLNNFLSKAEKIWSHATFDFVIVTETLKRLKITPSFKYYQAKDIRTLMDLACLKAKDFPKTGTCHDALDDCFNQVNYCVKALKKLKELP